MHFENDCITLMQCLKEQHKATQRQELVVIRFIAETVRWLVASLRSNNATFIQDLSSVS